MAKRASIAKDITGVNFKLLDFLAKINHPLHFLVYKSIIYTLLVKCTSSFSFGV